MWSKRFWMDATERAVKTAVQVAIPMVAATSLDAINWEAAGLSVLSAVLLSLFSSILSSRVGSPADASLVTDQPEGGVGK